MKIAACVAAGGICFSGMLACWAQAPENDQFANRIVLSGNSITFTGTLAGATIESGEIQVYNANSESVWWSWTATESTPVTLTVLEVSADTFMRDYLAIWLPTNVSGFPTNISPTALLWLDSSVTLPCLKFQAVAGATYQIQLIGSSGSMGRVSGSTGRRRTLP